MELLASTSVGVGKEVWDEGLAQALTIVLAKVIRPPPDPDRDPCLLLGDGNRPTIALGARDSIGSERFLDASFQRKAKH